MKTKLIIFLLALSFSGFGQAIGTNQVKDGAITPIKLSAGVGRPVNMGVLPSPILTFDQIWKSFTTDVTTDVALSVAGSGNIAHSKITIIATGDGSHVVTFPSDWIVDDGDVYDPTTVNEIEIDYRGSHTTVNILQTTAITLSTLTSAVVVGGTDDITLTFSAAVTITTAGWSVTASGGAATVSSVVSGSGTAIVVFDLSRNITAGETMSISYNPSTGNTVSLTGNELAVISNFTVDTGDGAIPTNAIFVDDDAVDDVAAGTIGDPFKTGQAGNNAAVAGQTVLFRAGTYRETIVPKDGVTNQNYSSEVAIISGLNEAGNTGWTVHSGSIYKKTITLPVTGFASTISSNTTLLANQIFKDGVMQFQARWPNITALADLLDRDKFRHHTSVSSWGQTSITDAGLPDVDITGGSVFITGWFIAQTRTITSSNGSSTIGYAATDQNSKFRRWYYVTNDLDLLDAEKEWHYQGGVLYFRQTGGGSPTGVEYKARNWGFDLRGKSNVQIVGLTFKGCEPATGDVNSHNNVIDNVRATYMNHAFMQVDPDQIYNSPKQNGIKFLGNNNTVKNSEFQYAASQVIWAGPGTIVENNLCSDISYEGNYGAFVTPYPGAGNIKILRNTVSRVGRSVIDFGYVEGDNHNNMEIAYNDFHTYLMLSNDGGCLYAARGIRLTGTRIHHNWLHDNVIGLDWDGAQGAADYDGIHVNLYFDQGTGPTTVDHNVFWNGGVADYYSQVISTTQNIYNNTFAHDGRRESYIVAQTTPNDVVRNNIFTNTVNINWTSSRGDVAYSLVPTTHTAFNSNNNVLSNSPLFVGPLETGLGYLLQSGSPARNTGTVIAGITDDDDGTPDMGAYKFADNADPWTAGYGAVTPTESLLLEDNNATFTTYSAGKVTFSNAAFSGGTASFFNTMNATVTINMTGTAFEWWAEKYVTAPIVSVKVDGVTQDCDAGTGGVQNCDLYQNTTTNNSQLIFSKTGMSAGAHTIVIEIVGANGSSTGTVLNHDVISTTP